MNMRPGLKVLSLNLSFDSEMSKIVDLQAINVKKNNRWAICLSKFMTFNF